MRGEDERGLQIAAAAKASEQQDHLQPVRETSIWCNICGIKDHQKTEEGGRWRMNGWFWTVLITILVAAVLPEWDRA